MLGTDGVFDVMDNQQVGQCLCDYLDRRSPALSAVDILTMEAQELWKTMGDDVRWACCVYVLYALSHADNRGRRGCGGGLPQALARAQSSTQATGQDNCQGCTHMQRSQRHVPAIRTKPKCGPAFFVVILIIYFELVVQPVWPTRACNGCPMVVPSSVQ